MKISIIVPIYNVENYLRRCIESIINQTYKNIEIILVNDGSTDKSGDICEEYALLDNRILVIHNDNCGVSASRNKGLELATGEYIGFVDSDDWIEPNMIKNLIHIAYNENADIVQCGFQFVLENGEIKCKSAYPYKMIEGKTQILQNYFRIRQINPVLWNKIYKKNIYKDIRMVEGRNNEDSMVIPELLLNCYKIINVPDIYYNYLQRDNTIMSSNFTEKSLDQLYAGDYVIDLCKRKIPMHLNDAYITSSLDCILLYHKLTNTNPNNFEIYEKIIIEKFVNNYDKIINSIEFKECSSKIKIAIYSFKINKKLGIFLLEINKRIKMR